MDGPNRLLIVFVLFLSACGQPKNKTDGPNKWASFPVPIYADSALVSSPQAKSDFNQAMAFWEAKAGKQLFDYRGVWTGGAPFEGNAEHPSTLLANVVFFQNPWPFAQNVAAQTMVLSGDQRIQSSLVMVNPNMPLCGGDCGASPYQISQRNVLAHELGHFLGLAHSNDIGNIMYPEMQYSTSLSTTRIDSGTFSSLVN